MIRPAVVTRGWWRTTGVTSNAWALKRLLLSLITLGALSFLTVTSTFALLNGETRNVGSTVASGTLTFNNKVNAGSLCYSYSVGTSGNANANCSALFSNATLMYPGTPATAQITITNDGSLDVNSLSVYMPSCTAVATPGAPSPGGGDPCGTAGANFYVQETDSSFTPTTCRFPAAAGACAFYASTLSYFKNSVNTAAAALNLGSGLAHGQSRYFLIGLQLPSTASNALQGEEALFSLTWRVST